MKLFLAMALFLASATVAIGEEKAPITLIPEVITADLAAIEADSLLPDCQDVPAPVVAPTNPETPWEYFLAAYPMILLILRGVAEVLGRLADKGSGAATVGARLIVHLMALLGWVAGKGGLGSPKAESVKKFPGWKPKKK